MQAAFPWDGATWLLSAAPWGDGCRAGVTSSLQVLWSLGGSDCGTKVRAVGVQCYSQAQLGSPPGPVLGGTTAHRPTSVQPQVPVVKLLVGHGAMGRAVGVGAPETPALPQAVGASPPRVLLWLMLKAGRRQRLALPPPSPSSRTVFPPGAESASPLWLKKAIGLACAEGQQTLQAKQPPGCPSTSWLPCTFLGCPPRALSPPPCAAVR